MNKAPGIHNALMVPRSATTCFAYVNSSADIGSRLRTFFITDLALPISSLIGRVGRDSSCLTYRKPIKANTNPSDKAAIVR